MNLTKALFQEDIALHIAQYFLLDFLRLQEVSE